MSRATSVRFLAPLLLLAALVLQVLEPGLLLGARLAVFDTYQRLAPRTYDPAAGVRIVAIDDRAIAEAGQWAWPRTRIAWLIDAIAAHDPALIVFNVVFAEPDRTSPVRLADDLRGFPGLTLPPPEALPDNDIVLAEAIGRVPTVLGFALTPRPVARRPSGLAKPSQLGQFSGDLAARFDGALANLELLEQAALGQGAINAPADADGVVRRLPMFLRLGDDLVLSLAAEAASQHGGGDTPTVRGVAGRRAVVRLGGIEVPTDAKGNVWSHFAAPDQRRVISAADVFTGNVDRAAIAGHIVVIGLTATGLEDQHATPLGNLIPGVEVQAQAIEQLVLGAFLVRPAWALAVEAALTAFGGLLLLLLLPRLGPITCAVGGAVAAAATIAASWLAFQAFGILLDPVAPSFAVLLVYFAAAIVSHLRSESERRDIRNTFSHFVAPQVVARLVADPANLRLGGEERELTLMFCDIRGFTRLSETLPPEQLTTLLNRFFTPMTDIIMDHRGTIDKFMGDSIMAFWNAPLDDLDHAAQACTTALAMRGALAVLNTQIAPPLAFGIGINTGPALVGNLGSERRLDYSALGDAVNLASRIEGQSKPFAVDIVISEYTKAAAPDFAVLELDRVRVVGRAAPVRLYALLGDAAIAAAPAFTVHAADHAAMLTAYRNRDWAAAQRALTACAEHPTAPPLARYYTAIAARIADFAVTPPPDEWDGTTTASRK